MSPAAMKETFIIRTSIKPQIMRRTLFKGSLLALSGVLTLLISGIFLPKEQLQYGGFLFFLFGIGCITFGLLPYRRLSAMELKPDELIANEREDLEFWSKGKKRFTIPCSIIDKIDYIETNHTYGLALWLNPSTQQPIRIHDPYFNIHSLPEQTQNAAKSSLFLKFFSKRSTEELKEWQELSTLSD
jgi:hypothetical protein